MSQDIEGTVEIVEQHDADAKTLTVEEVVNGMGFGLFQVLLTLFSGMLLIADAMELMVLSVLSPAIRCQWNLSSSEEAQITSVVFAGFLIGSLIWGSFCDMYGRKMGLLVCDIGILLFGVLSAIPLSSDDDKSPGYGWLLFCRFGVGSFAGGTSQSVTYYSEFLPQKGRGIALTFMDSWWAVGSMFGATLALYIMPGLGWHWYLALAASPLTVVLLFFPFVPESARYYVVNGRADEARDVLKTVAFYNCKPTPKGHLVSVDEQELQHTLSNKGDSPTHTIAVGAAESEHLLVDDEERGDDDSVCRQRPSNHLVPGGNLSRICFKVKKQACMYAHLFKDGVWRTTIPLMVLWFGCGWIYYGVILLTTNLVQYEHGCGKAANATVPCVLSSGDYIQLVWSAAAELPGLVVVAIIVELIGRKKSMAIEFFLCMVGFLLLFTCSQRSLSLIFLRATAIGVFQAVYVYTPEVYPTDTRAIAVGWCSSFARLGAITTPYVAQVLVHKWYIAAIAMYASSGLFLAIISLLLPIETKGRSMKDQGTRS